MIAALFYDPNLRKGWDLIYRRFEFRESGHRHLHVYSSTAGLVITSNCPISYWSGVKPFQYINEWKQGKYKKPWVSSTVGGQTKRCKRIKQLGTNPFFVTNGTAYSLANCTTNYLPAGLSRNYWKVLELSVSFVPVERTWLFSLFKGPKCNISRIFLILEILPCMVSKGGKRSTFYVFNHFNMEGF